MLSIEAPITKVRKVDTALRLSLFIASTAIMIAIGHGHASSRYTIVQGTVGRGPLCSALVYPVASSSGEADNILRVFTSNGTDVNIEPIRSPGLEKIAIVVGDFRQDFVQWRFRDSDDWRKSTQYTLLSETPRFHLTARKRNGLYRSSRFDDIDFDAILDSMAKGCGFVVDSIDRTGRVSRSGVPLFNDLYRKLDEAINPSRSEPVRGHDELNHRLDEAINPGREEPVGGYGDAIPLFDDLYRKLDEAINPGREEPIGGYFVQISSQATEEAALIDYQRQVREFASIIGGNSVDVQRANIPGHRFFYCVRILAGTKQAATEMCERLKAAGGDCFVAR